MRQKKLVIGLLVMLALVVTSFTYAYWSSVSLTGNSVGNSVVIGEGRTATVAVTTAGVSGTLVPAGKATTSISTTPVEYVIFTFDTDWNDNLAAVTGTLAATVSNIKIGGVTTNAGLVITAVQIGGTVTAGTLNGNGSTAITPTTNVNVYVKVTLTEPTTQAIYDAIKNATITFDVTFVVTTA